jgi:hypothetical protein
MGGHQAHEVVKLFVGPGRHGHAIWALRGAQAAAVSHVVFLARLKPASVRVNTSFTLFDVTVARVITERHAAGLSSVLGDAISESLGTLVVLDLLRRLLLLRLFLLLLRGGLRGGEVRLLPLTSTSGGVFLKIREEFLLRVRVSLDLALLLFLLRLFLLRLLLRGLLLGLLLLVELGRQRLVEVVLVLAVIVVKDTLGLGLLRLLRLLLLLSVIVHDVVVGGGHPEVVATLLVVVPHDGLSRHASVSDVHSSGLTVKSMLREDGLVIKQRI